MSARDEREAGYEVPTYEASKDASFYHFMHGNVPGHEIDFIYRPDMKEGPLSRQHFGHLSWLLMFIEPRELGGSAFAIGNLSRDDTQHEPGHGGVALIVSLRIRGARDHAGRRDPSFSHAIAAIDRDLDAETLFDAALSFQHKVLSSTRMAARDGCFYHAYAQCAGEPEKARELVETYASGFADLPSLGPSKRSLRYAVGGVEPPRRIVIAHEDGAPFEDVARVAARVAAVLYQSDVKWTVISNGRESDLPKGVTVRLLPASAVGAHEDGAVIHRLAELPASEEELAARLFGAKPLKAPGKEPGWRDVAAAERAEEEARARRAAEARAEQTATVRMEPRRRSWKGLAGLMLVAGLGIGLLLARSKAEPPAEQVQVQKAEPAAVQAAAPRVDEPAGPPGVDVGTAKTAKEREAVAEGAASKTPGKPIRSGAARCRKGSVLGSQPLDCVKKK